MVLCRLVTGFVAVLLMLSAGCAPEDSDPKPKDWAKESAAPEPTEPSPSSSPTEQESDEGDRERYEDIDLESGDEIPEGACGEYPPPETRREFRAIEQCNPGHDYGVCPVGDDGVDENVIVGASGDDVLEGTSGSDLICGLGGNDIIVGGGGEDRVWGGPGNDYVVGGKHSDSLNGGDGDDILVGNNSCLPVEDKRCGPDFIKGDTASNAYADSGDDVLLGGSVSFGEDMAGGPGNDLMAPTPLRTGKNYVVSGAGTDVAVTLNFIPGRPDHVWLKELESGVKFDVPLNSACKAKVEIDFEKREEGAVTCSLPWGKRLSGLDTLLPVSASIDGDGKVSMDMTLYNRLGNMSVSSYREMLDAQASLAEDVCVCDLYTKNPPDVRIPYDYPGDG